MASILVTGGAGFIGSHLTERLLKEGHRVIVVDHFNDYYPLEIKKKNISEIQESMKKLHIDSQSFKLYKEDIRNKEEMEGITAREGIDAIIHLAAMAGVRPSICRPDLYFDINVNGTLSLLEAARKNRIEKFIFASSSSVYGNNEQVPFSEDQAVDHPISPYAASKKAGELICYTYHHLHHINMACLRFFTVYGPRQRPDLAISKFTRLMLDGRPIPFYGDGTTARDYTYIDDIIDGILKAYHWLFKGEDRYEVFNLGESGTISLQQMVKTLEDALSVKADIQSLPMQPGDVRTTWADISKAKSFLGYSPSTSFADGIASFIEWYKKGMM